MEQFALAIAADGEGVVMVVLCGARHGEGVLDELFLAALLLPEIPFQLRKEHI